MQSVRVFARWLMVSLTVCVALVASTAWAASPTASLKLSTSNAAPGFGQSITLTALVTITGSSVSTMGAYSIYDGSTALVSGKAPNMPNGYVYATSKLSVGTHTLTAKYAGTVNGLKATSPAVIVKVAAAPTITLLSPSSATAGGAAFTLTVTGSNFIAGTKVKWGSTALTTTVKSTTEVTAPVTKGMIADAGKVNVTVTNSGGTSAAKVFAIDPKLSITTPPDLPPADAGVTYVGFINVSGGGPSYQWTVNGIAVSTTGTPVSVADGITAKNTGGNTLTLGGKPSLATTVHFSVSVKDAATGVTAGPDSFSIVVAPGGNTISGHINLGSVCGNGGNPPPITVTISTTPVERTTTNSSGYFQFEHIPNGAYTITPSTSGPSSVFYPATQRVTVNTGPGVANFKAALGYTVSGTVDYSGPDTGRIYVVLNNNNCGGSTPGTSIASKGAFTIRGVPPGSYSVQAWMDTLGYGAPNAADPSTNVNSPVSFSVSNANVTGVAASLGNPAAVTLSNPPGIQGTAAFDGGALLFFKPILDNNNVELATSYIVEWSTAQAFPSTVPAGQTKSFPAVGSNGTGIWIIDGLSNGTAYYFRVRGVAGSSKSPWYETSSALTVNAPSTGATISGAVTFSGTATGPLYTGFYDGSNGTVYATMVGSKHSPPTSPAPYTVKVPSGSGYIHFGILDQENLGVVVPGDVSNTNGNNSAPIAITGNEASVDLALPTSDSTAVVATQHNQQIDQFGTGSNYNLQFEVNPGIKLPVAVTLTSASNPNVVLKQDIGQCNNCGGSGSFSFGIDINNSVPKVGDSYGLALTYSDGTTATQSAAVTGVLSSLPSHLEPAGSGTSTKPNFSWTDPANASDYTYNFQLQDASYNTIWQIPGNNSNSNGFPSTVTSLAWGVPPAGYSGDTPSVTALSNEEYTWSIQASDTNGNSASTQVNYKP